MAGAQAVALIQVEGLGVETRLADISFALEEGEMLGVIGPNGAGKSTLLHCLAGLLPYRGAIGFVIDAIARELSTLTPATRARQIGFLPQFCDSAWPLAVADIVALGRIPWNDQDAAVIWRAMDAADVTRFAARPIDHLSGGEQARVWLARALAATPRLLLADEPVASLDLYFQRKILDTLRCYADDGHGIILTLHDLGLAARYCDKLCLMNHGAIQVFGPPAAVLTAAALTEVFGLPIHVDLGHRPPVVIPR
jgi:iron complex transport system ATP-binding protein